jgi:hypothetical protein
MNRPPIVHDLKCWPIPFDAIMSGEKTFEWRKNDRDYRVGDILILHKYNPELDQYMGPVTKRKITHILKEGFGIPEGYAVLSLESHWKQAIIDKLVINSIYSERLERDPYRAVHELLAWECDVALDPKVSKRAAELQMPEHPTTDILQAMNSAFYQASEGDFDCTSAELVEVYKAIRNRLIGHGKTPEDGATYPQVERRRRG